MRKVSHWTLAALGALCLSGSVALPLAAAEPAPRETPLHNVADDGCLYSSDGFGVALAECNPSSPSQTWSREYLGNAELLRVNGTNSCLGQVDGPNVRLSPCDSYDQTQQWRIEPADSGSLIWHPATNSCLGNLGQEQVRLFSCDPSNPAQQWVMS
ncbi:ricin-type beta-trefoil lectin protein [Saccharopolyspora spinosa]|uniref:Ricin-type beta-trefoil lectin protein n=1 Tax=Saccharopolyspora spinosa TaxID=60894 RepID=A0A2N3XYS3_SACSN|nr:ricin-type beta-trefoil lectin protein [Saccharopolyspora spinosa]